MNAKLIVRLAATSAKELYDMGRLAHKDLAAYTLAESRVRARMSRRGKSWSLAQIRRRAKTRVFFRKLPGYLGIIPGPIGVIADSVDSLVDSIIPAAYEVVDRELKK